MMQEKVEKVEKDTQPSVAKPEAKPEERKKYIPRGQGRTKYSRPGSKFSNKKFFFKKKACFFCKNKKVEIDYKDVSLMKRFVAVNGKITPRRFSGTCAKHQRKLATEIKKARQMALIPFIEQ